MASQTASAPDGSETQGRQPPHAMHSCLADLPDGSDLTSTAPHPSRTGGNQGGAVTLPSSPELGRHRGEQESMEAKRARKSESPAGPGYRHSLTGVAAEVCWRELADNLRGLCQARAESMQHSQPPSSSKQTTGHGGARGEPAQRKQSLLTLRKHRPPRQPGGRVTATAYP